VPDSLKILVVEDAEADFPPDRASSAAARAGRRVRARGEPGTRCRAPCCANRFDLALVDYHIPGLEIQDSLGRIQADAPGTCRSS